MDERLRVAHCCSPVAIYRAGIRESPISICPLSLSIPILKYLEETFVHHYVQCKHTDKGLIRFGQLEYMLEHRKARLTPSGTKLPASVAPPEGQTLSSPVELVVRKRMTSRSVAVSSGSLSISLASATQSSRNG